MGVWRGRKKEKKDNEQGAYRNANGYNTIELKREYIVGTNI